MNPGPFLVCNFIRGSKHDNVGQQTELTHANPANAIVNPDVPEATVSLEDLAPGPKDIVNQTRLN